jgi:hypothetical protein
MLLRVGGGRGGVEIRGGPKNGISEAPGRVGEGATCIGGMSALYPCGRGGLPPLGCGAGRWRPAPPSGVPRPRGTPHAVGQPGCGRAMRPHDVPLFKIPPVLRQNLRVSMPGPEAALARDASRPDRQSLGGRGLIAFVAGRAHPPTTSPSHLLRLPSRGTEAAGGLGWVSRSFAEPTTPAARPSSPTTGRKAILCRRQRDRSPAMTDIP